MDPERLRLQQRLTDRQNRQVPIPSPQRYNLFRTYDPNTGRYLQVDPIGQAGGLHLYQYARLNPENFRDPLGLSPEDVERIREAVQRSVSNMVTRGSRSPGSGWLAGMLNNLRSSGQRVVSADQVFLACGGQAAETQTDLLNLEPTLDDRWEFELIATPIHTWLEATSDNASDPQLSIDPWRNAVRQKMPPEVPR